MVNIRQWRPTRTGIIFVIVTLVLAMAVFVGAWIVQYRGEQVRQQQAPTTAEQQLEQDSPPVVVTEETPPTEESAASNGDQSEAQPANNAPEQLPATGTDEVVVTLGVLALALGLTYYASSRRALRQL